MKFITHYTTIYRVTKYKSTHGNNGTLHFPPFYLLFPLFTLQSDNNIEFLLNKVLDIKTLIPYFSEYANSLTNNWIGPWICESAYHEPFQVECQEPVEPEH